MKKNKVTNFMWDVLNNLDSTEVRELFSRVSELMKHQIIGYIKVADSYEPAISENQTFMPMGSFGISDITFEKCNFMPFPDNKTLYDMCEDPIEFDNWCSENLV